MSAAYAAYVCGGPRTPYTDAVARAVAERALEHDIAVITLGTSPAERYAAYSCAERSVRVRVLNSGNVSTAETDLLRLDAVDVTDPPETPWAPIQAAEQLAQHAAFAVIAGGQTGTAYSTIAFTLAENSVPLVVTCTRGKPGPEQQLVNALTSNRKPTPAQAAAAGMSRNLYESLRVPVASAAVDSAELGPAMLIYWEASPRRCRPRTHIQY